MEWGRNETPAISSTIPPAVPAFHCDIEYVSKALADKHASCRALALNHGVGHQSGAMGDCGQVSDI